MAELLRPAQTKSLEEARAQIDGLWEIVIELKELNDEFKQQNDELREQVRELGERIGKSSRIHLGHPHPIQRHNGPSVTGKNPSRSAARGHSQDILSMSAR